MKGSILIVQFSANLDGSSFSALMLADGLRDAGWETHVLFSYQGPIISLFRDAGHQVSVTPHKSWLRTSRMSRFLLNFIREMEASRQIEEKVKEIMPHLIYINTAVSFAGALAAYRLNVPSIWHIRELFAEVGGEMKVPVGLKGFVRSIFRRLSGCLVVNSKAVASNMLGNVADQAHVVANAVDLHFFKEIRTREEVRVKLGLKVKEFIIGVPGTLRPMKGHPFFFKALYQIIREGSNAVAIISGGGVSEYVEEMESMVKEMGLTSCVHFLGYVDDMSAFYRASDIVCVPSVAEPFGRTVIEAFASGTPVVGSAVGGICEIIDDEHSGLLVPYGDVNKLAASLHRLIEDPGLRSRLREAARDEAERHYQASTYKKKLCDLVQQSVLTHTHEGK